MPILTHGPDTQDEVHVTPRVDDALYCRSCKHCRWMVAIGMGVSCDYWQDQDPESKRHLVPNSTFSCTMHEAREYD